MLNEELLDKKTELDKVSTSLELMKDEFDSVINNIQNAKNDLKEIEYNKKTLLQDIYNKAHNALGVYINRAIQLSEGIKELYDNIVCGYKKLEITANEFSRKISETDRKMKEMLDTIENIHTTAMNTAMFMDEAQKDLEKKIIKNSEFEKSLKLIEKDVKRREKVAEEKLQQAKDIAFWHKQTNVKITL